MIDETDRLILKELKKNGRIRMKELGEKVHLTGQAASDRVARLEQKGIIKGYTVEIDQNKLNKSVFAFITITMRNKDHRTFFTLLEDEEETVEKYYKISGDGCYMLQARFTNIEELDDFLTKIDQHATYKVVLVIKETEL
ncbi:Lrp/AsnC family transcriptional regulator [Marinilactibacillus piezotolerans]|uniref:Lrp/AsnC family transcriptional regulator n=1 Tax=Marinilactibacillus piezotolerans TaxID=258723 RepID=UPI0009B194E6|nr:Lrp/AsnC family transcriptional regulator [Marinilactibacillus piezotolerans]